MLALVSRLAWRGLPTTRGGAAFAGHAEFDVSEAAEVRRRQLALAGSVAVGVVARAGQRRQPRERTRRYDPLMTIDGPGGIGDDADPAVIDGGVADAVRGMRSPKATEVRHALGPALRLLQYGADRLAPALRAASERHSAKLTGELHEGLLTRFRWLLGRHPEAARAVLVAFEGCDPAFWRQLVNASAEAGDPWAVERVADDEPGYWLCWVRGDAEGLRAALAAIEDPDLLRVAVETLSNLSWQGRTPQLLADLVVPYAASDDLACRAFAVAALGACAHFGADVLAAMPALRDALSEHRAPKQPKSMSYMKVSEHAARALAWAAGTAADPAPILAVLNTALSHRRRDTRVMAAFGLGAAAVQLGDDLTRLAPVLDVGAREVIYGAVSGVGWAAPNGRLAAELVTWLVAHEFDPAWCFESAEAFQAVHHHLQVRTREGLGLLVDGLGSPRRFHALQALTTAARNGSDIGAAVPIITGVLFCGDWRVVHPRRVLECLRDAALAGAPVAGIVRWLASYREPGRPGAAEATEIERVAAQQTSVAPAGVPTPPPGPASAHPAASGSGPPTVPTVKSDDQLRALFRPLWTSPDPAVRRDVVDKLDLLQLDGADIRAAQPALAVAFHDPDPEASRAAVAITKDRAFNGADIRIALPALAGIAEHPDPDIRHMVWTALSVSDKRHHDALVLLADLAARLATEDPDPYTRDAARAVAERIMRATP